MQSGQVLVQRVSGLDNGPDPRGVYTFSKDEPVHNGGDTGGGVAYVDDQRRTLPRGKTERRFHKLAAVPEQEK